MMFRSWLKILPLFVVEWMARRWCSVREDGKWIVADPFDGVTVCVRLVSDHRYSGDAGDVCRGFRVAEYRDGTGKTVWKIEKFDRWKWSIFRPKNGCGREYDLDFYDKSEADEWVSDRNLINLRNTLTKVS